MSDEQDLAAKRAAISSALLVVYVVGAIALGICLAGLGLNQPAWTLGVALYAGAVGLSWAVAKRTRFGKYLWDIHTFWV
ncbi:MAG TPA: hypothetical protein VJ748_09745 [Vitreimonas sp.]|nr:hypothetical protein [Vitreimonas sp.]